MNELVLKLHALVADDNEADRLLVSRILSQAGCQVTEAEDGEQALQAYEQLHPDLVWLDILMPRLNGLEVCERIAPHAEQHQVPILVVTALSDNATIERAFEAGATDYIPKPFTATILHNRLRRLVHTRRVEKSIQRANREWEATFNAAYDMVLLTDIDGNVIRCNQATIRHFGTTEAAILGRPLTSLFYGNAIPQPGIFSADSHTAQFPRLKGWYQVSNYPVQSDSADGRVGYAHLVRDITLERQMAERLYANEQKFRALVENTSEGIQLIDASGKLLYGSPHVASMLGYEPGAIEDDIFRYLHPDDAGRGFELFSQLLRQPGGSVSTELRVRHKDGRWVWLHLTSRNLLNIAGVEAVLVNLRDITEQIVAEEKLRASEARYRTLFEDSPVALWEEDFSTVKTYLDHLLARENIADFPAYLESHPQVVIDCVSLVKVTDVNKAAMRMLGAARKEELFNSLTSVLSVDGYKGVRAQLVAMAEGRTYVTVENLNRPITGEIRSVTVIWSVWPGYEDTHSRITVSVIDLTERQRAEEKLHTVTQAVEQSSTAVIITDTDGNIEYVNPRFTKLTGYSLEEVQGRNPRLLKSGESPAEVYDQLWATITAGREWRGEFHNKKKDGEFYWAQASISPILNSRGVISRFLAVQEDITERKQAEAQLRATEERFKLVTYATNDAVWELDLVTRQRWWNAGVRSVFGYVPEQVGVDQAWWEALIHPDDRAKVLASLETALWGDGQFWSKEYRYRKADGTYAYVFDRGYVIQDEQGRPQRIIGAMMDITGRKQTEEALLQSEETFSKAFHASPLPMAILTAQTGLYLDVNTGWETLFKLKREAVIGHAIYLLGTSITEESLEDLATLLKKQGYVRDYEIAYEADPDDPRSLLISSQTVEIRGKTAYLITCYDITEQRRMHAAMAASQKLADLGTLAAGVAHEMNSPLQVITGVSQSLLRRLSTGSLQMENLKRNLDVIHRNGWRCAEIVRSLHTYARASSGALQRTDLNVLVRDTLLLVEHQLKSWANITVLTSLTPDLPLLTCDHNQITQVLINLLTNARDAMPQGGEISICTGYDAQTDQLTLSVQDSGIGIPDSIRDRIFDPFFTTKALGKGTGLGLSIVAGIVRAHGGTIDIDSRSRKGALFTMRFPVQPVKLPPADNDTAHGRFDTPAETAAASAEAIRPVPQGVTQ